MTINGTRISLIARLELKVAGEGVRCRRQRRSTTGLRGTRSAGAATRRDVVSEVGSGAVP